MKRGFTLAEVIIALIVVTLVMALSVPLLTKKTQEELALKNGQPWEWIGSTINAKFNSSGGNRALLIGMDSVSETYLPRMAISSNSDTTNHINFYQNGVKQGSLTINNVGSFLGNAPYIPSSPTVTGNGQINHKNVVVIGNVVAYGNGSVDIGEGTSSTGESVSIGPNTGGYGGGSVAIGAGANTCHHCSFDSETKTWDCHVTSGASVFPSTSVAIGYHAKTMLHTIAIGTVANASKSTMPDAKDSLALGYNTTVVGQNVYVIGNNSAFSMSNGTNNVSNVILIAPNTNMTSTTSNVFTCNYLNSNHSIQYDNSVILAGPSSGVILNGSTSAANIYIKDAMGGNVWCNDFTKSSDSRLKNTGKEYTSGIDKINKLKIYNYNFKNKPKDKRVGVIAQELMKIFPYAVSKGENGYYMIRQEDIFYSMVNALKDFDKKIKNIITGISNINKDLTDMELKVCELSKQTEKNAKDIKLLKQRVKSLEQNVDLLKNKKCEVKE